MEKSGILSTINELFCDYLNDNQIKLTENTTANDVEGWDSLTHIQLIVAIEKTFRIKFTSKEIMSWKNVGTMVDCVSQRL